MSWRVLLLLLVVGAVAFADGEVTAPPQERFDAAYQSFQKGQYEEAQRAFEALYKSLEESSELGRKAGYFVGLCYESRNDYEGAITWYRALAKRFPKTQTANNALANIQRLIRYSGGDFARLRSVAEARSLFDQGSYEKSIKTLEDAGVRYDAEGIKEKPPGEHDGDIYFLLGDSLRALERYREAAFCYQVAHKLGIPDALEYHDRSLRYIQRGRIFVGSLVVAVVLGIWLLAHRPWRRWERRYGSWFAAILFGWVGVGGLLCGLSLYLETAMDLEKPLELGVICEVIAVFALPIVATLLYGCCERRSWLVGLYGLAAAVATAALILHFNDWFMLLGL